MDPIARDGGPSQQPSSLQRPSDPPHPARILVSSNRKSVSYINLAKRFLQEHGEVQLSALGIAISSMVTVAEILKNKQLAEESRITTSLEWLSAESRVRHKPKMTVVLTKSARFDETIMAEGAHGSYANDDEDTYEDADYSDAAFRDPRVPDVGEGDITQLPEETMVRAPLGPAPSEVLHPSTRFLNDDGTRSGGVPTGRGEGSGGSRPGFAGASGLSQMGGGGGLGGSGAMYSDPGLASMYPQAHHTQRSLPPLPQQQMSPQPAMMGPGPDTRGVYGSYGGGPASRQSPRPPPQAFDMHSPLPQQHWQSQADAMAAAQLHGSHNVFQQPAPQLGTSPLPQSPQTSSRSNASRTYNFGHMQGALADAAGAATASLGGAADASGGGGGGGRGGGGVP